MSVYAVILCGGSGTRMGAPINKTLLSVDGEKAVIKGLRAFLQAADGAVLVVCAVEGVQPQTEVLFHALKEQNIPTIIFINKMDREGADPMRVLGQIRRTLSPSAALFHDADDLLDIACALDDDLLAKYLTDTPISFDLLQNHNKY